MELLNLVNPVKRDLYIEYLLFLNQIQSILFIDTIFPSDINKLITILAVESIRTLNGMRLRDPVIYYVTMPYTIYKGYCNTPDDHTIWNENYDDDEHYSLKYTCKCQFGFHQENIDNFKKLYRCGNYMVFNQSHPYNSHIIECNVSDQRINDFFCKIQEYLIKDDIVIDFSDSDT